LTDALLALLASDRTGKARYVQPGEVMATSFGYLPYRFL
jgi:hypothetical protein